LAVLEFISGAPERPRALSEIAAQFKMNQSTCAHLVKTLVNACYLEQIAPQKGYILGPMAYFLTRNGPYRADLVKAAEPLMRQLAADIEETVVLAIMRNGKRSILNIIEGNKEVRLAQGWFARDDVYGAASGMLLLAHEDGVHRSAFLAAHGLPDPQVWPGVKDEKGLWLFLDVVKEKGVCCMEVPGSLFVQVAVPVFNGVRQPLALGVPVSKIRFTGASKNRIMNAIKAAAEAIGSALGSRP